MDTIQINFQAFWEIGTRDEQQDRVGHVVHNGIHRFVVVDGMGGVENGNEIADRLCQQLLRSTELHDALVSAHTHVQEWLNDLYAEVDAQSRPGAVVTIMEVDTKSGQVNVQHLGDTRLYVYQNNKIIQVTEDQVDSKGNPVQDIGLPTIEPISYTFECKPTDKMFLCTDGAYRILGKHDTASLQLFLKQNTVAQMTEKFLTEGQNQFVDNASGYFIAITEPINTASVVRERPKNRLIWIALACFVLGWLVASGLEYLLPVNQSDTVPQLPLPTVDTPKDDASPPQ